MQFIPTKKTGPFRKPVFKFLYFALTSFGAKNCTLQANYLEVVKIYLAACDAASTVPSWNTIGKISVMCCASFGTIQVPNSIFAKAVKLAGVPSQDTTLLGNVVPLTSI